MQYTVKNDTPFQILTSAIVIGPSQTGYQLEVAADGKNFSPLFTVGANVTRQATNLSSGAYYRLNGNVGDVIVNWVRSCVTPGGSGGSGTELSPVTEFPLDAEAGTVVAYNGTASASGVYQYTGEEWVPVGVDDLSDYWTSAQTEDAISAATSGKADAANVQANTNQNRFPRWNEQGIITGTQELASNVSTRINGVSFNPLVTGSNFTIRPFFAPQSAGTAGDILVSTGNGAPVWSAVTFPTPDVDKAYVDSAITAVEDHLSDVEQVTASALTELHEGLVEVSGRSVDLSAYYTSAQTEDAISAATSGKADAASVSPNSSAMLFPSWNGEGIITGSVSPTFRPYISINNRYLERVTVGGGDWYSGGFYAPESAGTAGDILVSTGNGAPVWSAMTFPTPDVDKAYVDSAITGVQDQIDVMDEVIPAAIVDLNTRKVESTSVHTIWRGTQAEYDAITTKDASTLYIIL